MRKTPSVGAVAAIMVMNLVALAWAQAPGMLVPVIDKIETKTEPQGHEMTSVEYRFVHTQTRVSCQRGRGAFPAKEYTLTQIRMFLQKQAETLWHDSGGKACE